MVTNPLLTFFAPPDRADPGAVRCQNETVAEFPLLGALLDSFPEGAFVLNAQRQIVFANDKAADLLARPRAELVGLRVGEALSCVHAHGPPAGCGTTAACMHCGAARAMEDSRLNRSKEVRECRLQVCGPGGGSAVDLRVWASPLELAGERFTVLALRDISDEKRRHLLERIFFHDVLNLAGGLRGALDLLPRATGEEAAELERLAATHAEQLVEEIECHRDLVAAEKGELTVRAAPVLVRAVLDQLCQIYGHHPVGAGRRLAVEAGPPGAAVHTDAVLLRRVLGNLVKNALEASGVGESVAVRYARDRRGHVFAVSNAAVLGAAVRAQMFQRSFSTKGGRGRGVGSYSVKLLTERYLGGRVEFESVPGEGTTFRVVLPAGGPEPVPPPVDPGADPGELVGTSVLLAEASGVDRLAVTGMLRKRGARVWAVPDGAAAVEAVRERAFSAVLMALDLPGVSGPEAAAQIRAAERRTGGHVPIVGLAADPATEGRDWRGAGMDACLTKPLALRELLAALARFRCAAP